MNLPALGTPKSALDTPLLCIDLDVMESNIRRMASYCQQHGVAWRPHAKCHKSTGIGKKLIEAGAIGLTCAKVGEAEVMADAGITDLLIANLIVGPRKIERLAHLRRKADPIVCIDHIHQAEPLSAAMEASGQKIRVIIELNIGMNRVGVEPGEATLSLARSLSRLPGLELAGIMGYEGHLLMIADEEQKEKRIQAALQLLVENKQMLEADGIACPIVSCGGTGSYRFAAAQQGITEIQAGGAIFMDHFYRRDCNVREFEYAMTVIATIVSRPTATRAIMDAGRKTMNQELQMPTVRGREGITVQSLSAEHGTLSVAHDVDLNIGDRIELIVGYSDWTSVLHNHFYGFRGDRLEVIWPLQARGHIQ